MPGKDPRTPFLEVLEECFKTAFRENWAVATLVYFAAASRSFSVALKGSSSSGKSTLVKRVVELVPPENVISLTRVSTAALLRMDELAVVVCDELITDRTLANVRRQLISEGRATAKLVLGGDLVDLDVRGPVAFVDCIPPGQEYDIQDSSRVVTARLAETDDQFTHHAVAVINQKKRAGRSVDREWQALIEDSRSLLSGLNFDADADLDIDAHRLLPTGVASHLTRRLEQVLALAKVIAVLTKSVGPDGAFVYGELEVRRALHLLISARVEDDHEQLPEETRRLAQALGKISGLIEHDALTIINGGGVFTIEDVLKQLNDDAGIDTTNGIVHVHKRRGGGRVRFTRRIVTRHLNILRDLHLLDRGPSERGYEWRFTDAGCAWLRSGSMNSFTQILAQLNTTTDLSDAD